LNLTPNLIKFYFNKNFIGDIKEWLDPRNDYTLNNYGYRGPDFSKDVDLVAAGCSVTYGIGVPEKGSWPHIAAKKLKLSYVNLSKPGASIEWIVDSLFSYFFEFGNPKNVFVLFPGPLRKEIVLNNQYNMSKYVNMEDFMHQGMSEDLIKGVVSYTFQSPRIKDKSLFLKRPFPIEETLPPETAVYRSFRSIRMLEVYCKSSNINLMWGTWSDDLANLMRSIPLEYSSPYFLQIYGLSGWSSHFEGYKVTAQDPEGIFDIKLKHTKNSAKKNNCLTEKTKKNCVCYDNCHEPLKKRFPDSFYLGTDRLLSGKESAHIGVHKHAHIADDFVRGYKQKSAQWKTKN
jgi:hypothetical protein